MSKGLVEYLEEHIAVLESQVFDLRCALGEIMNGGYGDPVVIAREARARDMDADKKADAARARAREAGQMSRNHAGLTSELCDTQHLIN